MTRRGGGHGLGGLARPLATALCVALASPLGGLRAQDLVPSAERQRVPVLIENAVIHTVSMGTFGRGSLLIEDGLIRAVSRGALERPAGEVLVIAGEGRHVYPGFVLATSRLGLTEVGMVDMSNDYREAGALTPEVLACVAVNPDSTLLPVARRNGVLTAAVMPVGGLVPGRASILRLDGWTNEDLTLVPDAGLLVSWPGVDWADGSDASHVAPGDRSDGQRALAQLDELFDAAAAYAAARASDPGVRTDLRLEAVGPVLRGERPVLIVADAYAAIVSAVEWAARREVRPVILGGRDAALCADLLARHDVPVVIDSSLRLPHRRDLPHESTFELPGELQAAGVRWCMATGTGEASNARNLPYEAAACIPHGLDPEQALRSVTLSPAEILGLGGELGSIEPGKRATLFIADGDPFEFSTRIEIAFIDGRRIDLTDKQVELDRKYREKYRQLGLLPDGD